MKRRTLLALAPVSALVACANRGPRLTLATIDVKGLGLLTIKEEMHDSNVGPFNAALTPGALPAAQGGVVPATPAGVGMGIGLALRAHADAEANAKRAAIARALQPVGLAPRAELQRLLLAAFERQGQAIRVVTDEGASERARTKWEFTGLPADMDAVLDIKVSSCGYYLEEEAGGFTPYIDVNGQLLATAGRGHYLDGYRYRADYRAGEDDRRYLPIERGLIVPTMSQFASRAEAIRGGMLAVMKQVADRLAEDVVRGLRRQEAL